MRRSGTISRVALLAALLVACRREPTPPSPALPEAARRPAPTDAAARPRTCEVEARGTLDLPPGAPTGDANYLFATVGDCLAPEPRVIGWAGNLRGRFFIEVFVPWGSDITLCAVSIAPPGQPSTLYGRSAPLHAEGLGEVEFKDLVIPLRPGPPHLFPRPPGR